MNKFKRVLAVATLETKWDSFCWVFLWTEKGYSRSQLGNSRESFVAFDDFADLSNCLDWFSDQGWRIQKSKHFHEAQ